MRLAAPWPRSSGALPERLRGRGLGMIDSIANAIRAILSFESFRHVGLYGQTAGVHHDLSGTMAWFEFIEVIFSS